MKRPTKKEIRDSVEKLKPKPIIDPNAPPPVVGKVVDRESNIRIRKKGV